MNDSHAPHEQALQNLQPPAPRPQAEQAALQAALAAFQAKNHQPHDDSSQGTADSQRLSSHAAAIMPPFQQGRGLMQRAKLIGRMTLGLVLVGTVGLVGYESLFRDSRINHAPVAAHVNPARVSVSPSVGGFGAHTAGSGQDINDAIKEMQNQAEQDTLLNRLRRSFSGDDKTAAAPATQPTKPAEKHAAAPTTVNKAAPPHGPFSAGMGAGMGGSGDYAAGMMAGDGTSIAAAPPRVMSHAAESVVAPAQINKIEESRKGNELDQGKADNFVAADRVAPPATTERAVAAPAVAAPAAAPVLSAPPANGASIDYKAAGKSIAVPGSVVVPLPPAPLPAPVSPLVNIIRAPAPGEQETFAELKDNPVQAVAEAPVSTFALDEDKAAYSYMRRALNDGLFPPKDAVRVEELINYFDYDYALPETREAPFKPSVTILPTPWNSSTQLLHIGIKGFDIPAEKRPQANLVFLIDTSGSMDEPKKLPLVKNALKMLVETLQPQDRVAIVTYAGEAGTALPPTAAGNKAAILAAIDRLGAGGSTAGAAGLQEAYNLAQQSFMKEGVNRVILATDGDFNVGITDPQALQSTIERARTTGIFLSVLGFGESNYNDALMQRLAQHGNGTAAYIDNLNEARRVLVDQASRTLFPIAKDVKFQVEFNPALVTSYRLIGYETRALAREDFNNDKVDAGEIGAGASVTAIYEITPRGVANGQIDDLRYGKATEESQTGDKKRSGEYGFLKIRYKLPKDETSKLISTPITSANLRGTCPPETKCEAVAASDDVRFSVAVAGFGQLLRGGKYTGSYGFDDVITAANAARGTDEFGLRSEFVNLVRLAKNLPGQQR